ncbi:hypothetical protein FSPOR_10553 [Fusarium sporotrichioides]|uniref:Uncharacterized protein n=1 Tax=Fusarium sporotrichioides TaxID=5514 RepID=A0A395RKG9_FUSSP|nr:hypothetical protein FSPOR_10553 [Fusarium sporotrichioides]
MSSEAQPSNTINLSHQAPITSAEIMVDSDCVQSLDKGTTIYSKDDLTRQEKEALYDLLREWCTTRPNKIVTPALVQVFFAWVFQAWNSENDCISLPVVPGKKKLAESAVPVVNGDHVRLDDDTTMERAITKACINWDQTEKARVQVYNTSLVIALARLRIVNFAKAGTDQLPVVPGDLCVNQRLMRCQLISDGFARIMEVMNNVGRADYLM